VGREIPLYLSVEEFPEKRAPLTAFDRENGKGKWAGKRWEGNIHNREHIRNMHNTGLKSMHENLIRSMHENVNEYADDLNKLFFKQTVSQDLSISKSAHPHFCFKH
jgi:hypothetical protein